ncbi:hypothetical protein [Pseudonocardia adelaidensis]|uniref:Uncharacterized protein n=1 Tax=Pseudonocardia adelaidensis TaxID=648754 RepID=A0ABP9NCQ2_9PSEU
MGADTTSPAAAGWNVVTTRRVPAARNVGFPDVPLRDDRYERASEFADVACALWTPP